MVFILPALDWRGGGGGGEIYCILRNKKHLQFIKVKYLPVYIYHILYCISVFCLREDQGGGGHRRKM